MAKREPERTVQGVTYLRLAVKTPIITPDDDIVDVVDKHAGGLREAGDIVVVAESPVAISQGRAIPESEIRIGLENAR